MLKNGAETQLGRMATGWWGAGANLGNCKFQMGQKHPKPSIRTSNRSKFISSFKINPSPFPPPHFTKILSFHSTTNPIVFSRLKRRQNWRCSSFLHIQPPLGRLLCLCSLSGCFLGWYWYCCCCCWGSHPFFALLTSNPPLPSPPPPPLIMFFSSICHLIIAKDAPPLPICLW